MLYILYFYMKNDGTNMYIAIYISSVNWDTRVVDVIEDFYMYDGYRRNHTTFRDLVAHKTGIPRHDYTWIFGEFSREQVVTE